MKAKHIKVLSIALAFVLFLVGGVNTAFASTTSKVISTGSNSAVIAYLTSTRTNLEKLWMSFGTEHHQGDPDEPVTVTCSYSNTLTASAQFTGTYKAVLVELSVSLSVENSVTVSMSQTFTKTIVSSKPDGWYRVELQEDWRKLSAKVQREGVSGSPMILSQQTISKAPMWPGFALVKYMDL